MATPPDGRFVAYVSDESGRYEVYVASFPAPSLRVAISNGGGYQPRWRRDGKELLYTAGDNTLMSVDVTLGGTFKAGVPKVLFQASIFGGGASQQHRWDMTADGQRFLITARGGDVSAREQCPSPKVAIGGNTAMRAHNRASPS